MKLIVFLLIACAAVVLILLNKKRKPLLKTNKGQAASRPDTLDSNWLPTPPPTMGGGPARAKPDSIVKVAPLIRGSGSEDSGSKAAHTNSDDYAFDIVGESHYQSALSDIAGSRERESKKIECTAKIIRERSNQYDSNACAVKINNRKVGYISKADNKKLIAELGEDGFPVEVRALIVGGWKTARSEGNYGVKLALPSNSPPASANDRAMVRYVEGAVPRGMTKLHLKSRLQAWRKEDNERFYQWEHLQEITEHLQSEDGRLEFEIKKLPAKVIMAAFDELIAEGLEVDDFTADEVVERLTSAKPDL